MEALCTRIVDALVPSDPRDDVVVAVARVPPVPRRLSGRWPADPHALARVRQELRPWLRAQGAGDVEANDITIASQEACTNAVEHAYGPGRHSFSVEAECEDGLVAHHRPRRGELAAAAREQPRPRAGHDARADGPGRRAARRRRHRRRPGAPARRGGRVSLLARVSEEQVRRRRGRRIAGEIDASNARLLGARLRAALSNRSVALVVDLAAARTSTARPSTCCSSSTPTCAGGASSCTCWSRRRRRWRACSPSAASPRRSPRTRRARRRSRRPRPSLSARWPGSSSHAGTSPSRTSTRS